MRKRNNIQLILLILVIALGIGYAYINSDLNINGTATINNASWDVHWANVQVANGSVSASTPTIANGTTVNYSVTLNNPGDYYEFTVDAVNAGTIDAMIDTMNSKLNGATITTLPDYLNYSVTYADGVELEANHELLANTTETYRIRVEYSTDINLNQIPATNQTLSLQFTTTYRQSTDNSIQRVRYAYTVNRGSSNVIYIDDAIPNTITQYNTATEAIAAYDGLTLYPAYCCLKHKIENGIVTESYVIFKITPEMVTSNPGMTAGTYAFRGGENERDGGPKTIYESNKAIALTAFGSSYCTETVSASVTSFECDVSEINAFVTDQGYVDFSNYNRCLVEGFRSSYCY